MRQNSSRYPTETAMVTGTRVPDRGAEQSLLDALPVFGEVGGLLTPLALDGEVAEHLAGADSDVDHERADIDGGHCGA